MSQTSQYARLSIVALIGIASVFSVGCTGRRTRAEIINFVNVMESTRVEANLIIDDWSNIEFEGVEDAGKLEKKTAELAQRIDNVIAPIKNLELSTYEAEDLRKSYIATWESFRDMLDMIGKTVRTQDVKMAMIMQEQLPTKAAEYEKNAVAFEGKYKQLIDKYGITPEDLTVSPQMNPITPVNPTPFTQAPPQ